MADTKISNLTAATTPLDGTEVLPIVQSSTTKKVSNNDLRPKQIQSNATSGVMQIVGPAAAATRVMTIPDANFTAARTDAAQTFSGTQTFRTTTAAYGSSIVVFENPWSVAGLKITNLNPNGVGLQSYATDNPSIPLGITLNPLGGDVKVVDNFVQGTAAKGVNFTANTPAAGMTSQLLNWYEEGTWTPSVTVNSGTATSYTIANSVYTRIGRQVTVKADITPVGGTFGNGTSYCQITGIPFLPSSTFIGVMGNTSNFYKGEFAHVGCNSVNYNVDIAAGITITVGNKASIELTYFV